MNTTTTLIAALTALAFVTVSCGEKKAPVPHDHDGDGKPDHAEGDHPKPVPHDHDGDGVPDHGPGAHGEAVPHDHDGDGKPDHGPDAHKAHDQSLKEALDAAHGHEHPEKMAGPNGGRVITVIEPHAEFFVTAEQKVQITFLGEDNKPVAPESQSVKISCGDRNNPTLLNPTKSADGMSLISTNKLPDGNNFPTIVAFKTTADAKPVRAKFTLNLSDCPSCDYKEYACTCDHAHSH